MIFQHTWRLILEGKKTETRRPVKPGEFAFDFDNDNMRINCVTTNTGRIKWEVGKTYSVQPGRGMPTIWWRDLDGRIETNIPQYDPLPKPWHDRGVKETLRMHNYQPLRIRITAIRQEWLHQISEVDAKAEGVDPAESYRSEYFKGDEPLESYVAGYRQLWDKINARKGTRWIDSPRVWVLTFERVDCELGRD